MMKLTPITVKNKEIEVAPINQDFEMFLSAPKKSAPEETLNDSPAEFISNQETVYTNDCLASQNFQNQNLQKDFYDSNNMVSPQNNSFPEISQPQESDQYYYYHYDYEKGTPDYNVYTNNVAPAYDYYQASGEYVYDYPVEYFYDHNPPTPTNQYQHYQPAEGHEHERHAYNGGYIAD